MKDQSSGIGLRQHLARRLLPSTLAIGVLLSVSLPLTYYLLEARRVRQTATIYAKEIADGVATIVGESPILWKYQVQKYVKMIYEYTPYKDIDHLHVSDEHGHQISEYALTINGDAAERPWKTTFGRAAVVFNNRPIGAVEVFMPTEMVFRNAFLIFLFSLVSGSGLAFFTYAFPLRVVRDADETIRRAHEELENKVEERTRDLAAANEALKLENEERKRAEEQLDEAQEELIRKEKLATLGRLSGSVGHELRNPLGVISNAVYFLKTVQPEADDAVKEYLDIIKSETENAERIITDLLDFSRVKTPLAQRVAVDELIKRGCGKCTNRENVTLQLEMPDTSPWVNVDPLHMEQVFRNLITNGIQSMPGGGVLTIRAKEDREDGTVRIGITDTGEGISPGNMKKLFQPLFTTKARGIGLGLIVSKNLVEANGGRIEVESQLGKGTTFTLTLPVGMG